MPFWRSSLSQVALLLGLSILFVLALVIVMWAITEWGNARWTTAATIVQSVGTVTAIFVGGGFAFYRLHLLRTFQPHLTIEQEVTHREIGDSYTHVFVRVSLRNSSRVGIELRQGFILLQQIAPTTDDKVEELYKERFSDREVEDISWSHLELIRRDWNKGELIVEPGETHQEAYEFIVTNTVETVLVNIFLTNSSIPVDGKSVLGWTATTVHDILRKDRNGSNK